MAKITDLDSFYEGIGVNIKAYRSKLGYSQEDLGKFVDLTRTSMVNIEKGRQRITVHTLSEVANFLKVSVEDLLPSKEEKHQIDFKKIVDQNVQQYSDISIDKQKMTHFFQISSSK